MLRPAARVKPGPRHPPLRFTPEFPLRHSRGTASALARHRHRPGAGRAGTAERPGDPGERAGRGGRVVQRRD